MSTQLAWAAGLFEGEGSIHQHSNGIGHGICLALGSTDLDIVTKFYKIVRRGKIYGPRVLPSGKPFYEWRLTRTLEAFEVANLLKPLLGNRRKQEIERLKTQWNAVPHPRLTKFKNELLQ